MKTTFLYAVTIISACAAILACNEKNIDPQPTLSVNPQVITFNAEGNSPATITINSNVKWEASVENDTDWITLNADSCSLTVSASDNTSIEQRSCTITVETCDKSETQSATITVTQEGKEATLLTQGLIWYYGKDFSMGTNNTDEYLVRLYTQDSDVKFSEYNYGSTPYWDAEINNGHIVSLYLYCNQAQDFFNPAMDTGTYTACKDVNEISAMTFTTSFYNEYGVMRGSYIGDYQNGERIIYNIIDGTVTVDKDNDSYSITAEFTLEDGTKKHYQYNGTPLLSLLGNPPYYSDLTENMTLDDSNISDIKLKYVEEWNDGILRWDFAIDGKYDEYNLSGSSLSLFSDNSYKYIPDGTYKLVDIISTDTPNTAHKGTYGGPFGSSGCFFSLTKENEDNYLFAPLHTGTISVKNNTDGTTTFTINAQDDNGHDISGEFTKTIVYDDTDNSSY